jgi:hypothetical protein
VKLVHLAGFNIKKKIYTVSLDIDLADYLLNAASTME